MVRFSLAWGSWRCSSLPGLYHSAVAVEILDQVRRRTGRVFHAMAPDVFMQFTLPAFSRTAVKIGRSLTVNGRSAKSNGGSLIAREGPRNWQQFVSEYGTYRGHATLYPEAPVLFNIIPDSALVAMDLFPDYYRDARFNYEAMWAYMHRTYKFEGGTWGILRGSRRIRGYHPFRLSRFLFYSFVHALLSLRVAVHRALLKRKLVKTPVSAPMNIRDCVRGLSSLEPQKT
jgi:hypothetical protein